MGIAGAISLRPALSHDNHISRKFGCVAGLLVRRSAALMNEYTASHGSNVYVVSACELELVPATSITCNTLTSKTHDYMAYDNSVERIYG